MGQSQTARFVLWSQLIFGCSLLICIALIPHFLFERNEGGVSNYGVHLKTIVPFTLGFGLSAWLLVRAALALPDKPAQIASLKRCLYGIGALLALVLFTTYPYQLNQLLKEIHITAAIMLFVGETGVGVWLALYLAPDRTNYGLLGAQVVGFGLSLLTTIGALHVLFIAQLLASAAFGSLLVRATNRLTGQNLNT